LSFTRNGGFDIPPSGFKLLGVTKFVWILLACAALAGCASYTRPYASLTSASGKKLDEMTRKFGYMEDDVIYVETPTAKKELY
jgi:hypothetical protein